MHGFYSTGLLRVAERVSVSVFHQEQKLMPAKNKGWCQPKVGASHQLQTACGSIFDSYAPAKVTDATKLPGQAEYFSEMRAQKSIESKRYSIADPWTRKLKWSREHVRRWRS